MDVGGSRNARVRIWTTPSRQRGRMLCVGATGATERHDALMAPVRLPLCVAIVFFE